jgi:hypothetical protein
MPNRLPLARDVPSRLPSPRLRGSKLVKKRVATAAPALRLLQRRQLLWLAEQTAGATLLGAPSLVVGHDLKLSADARSASTAARVVRIATFIPPKMHLVGQLSNPSAALAAVFEAAASDSWRSSIRSCRARGASGSPAVVAQYRQEWLTSTFPLAQPFNHAVKSILPSDQSYLALGSLADALAISAPDGPAPNEATRTELSELLRAATEEAVADAELPADIAHLIVQRLSEVEMALRHVRLGGPLAVKRATEALMGAVDVARAADEKARAAPSLKRVFAIAGVVWTILTATPGEPGSPPRLEVRQGSRPADARMSRA